MLIDTIEIFFSENFNTIFLVLNIFVLVVLIVSLIFLRDSRKRWNKVTDYLGDITKTVDSVRYGNLTKKINKLDFPDSEDLTESLNRMIETLKDREIMIDEFQKDLIKQNKILERTVNTLSDGLLIVNDEGEIYRANAVITDWFSAEGKSLLGKKIQEFIETPRKKAVPFLSNDEIIIPTKRSSNFSASAVELNLDDKKERYMIIIKNITDQVELETLKEDFVATLTHDLKVPIIAEANMIDMFLDETFGALNDKQKLALKNMQVSNKELLDLVQTVLDTYKIGRLTLYKENIMLKGLLKKLLTR
jgi:signal transduction histidine kinase